MARITFVDRVSKTCYEYIMNCFEIDECEAILVDARGGTGRTYLENTILASVRLMGPETVALAVAASGIAAMLLLQGRTFHSRFKAKPLISKR